MKINILGTDYELSEDKTDYLKGLNADGMCRAYQKTITIRELDGFLDSDSTPKEKENRKKEVIRHEIIHAFFEESGLTEYSTDERLVDWLAAQFPKIEKVFSEIGCLK